MFRNPKLRNVSFSFVVLSLHNNMFVIVAVYFMLIILLEDLLMIKDILEENIATDSGKLVDRYNVE